MPARLDVTPWKPVLRDLLARSLQIPSISGQEGPFTAYVADWARSHGLETDLFDTDENALPAHPAKAARHLPLAGRPTLVVKLPGSRRGRSLMFNAHADVVPAPSPERWTCPPFAGQSVGERVYGRGACDVKGPLAAALVAMAAIKQSSLPTGDLFLELVPGEEDCVGLGTLTSYARGYRDLDACVVLEPTENRPRAASRGGLRFSVTCRGEAVHGTVKWLGRDAIELLRETLNALKTLEARWHEPLADPLFREFPHTRPVTVDRVEGGDYQGMVADRSTIGGYLELLPGDAILEWKLRFERELRDQLAEQGVARGVISSDLFVSFTEEYGGHRLPPEHPLCRTAVEAYGRIVEAGDGLKSPGLANPADVSAFNSGCEAGLRASLAGTPTLVWGPGSLAQAHAVDEYIDRAAVEQAVEIFTEFAVRWCGSETAE